MKNKKECIQEINSLLSKSDEKLAAEIYSFYKDKLSVKLAVEESLIHEMKDDLTEYTFNQLKDVFARIEISKLESADICSTEAITTWAKYRDVNTSISMEVLDNNIHAIHEDNVNLQNPKSLVYYADNTNTIANIPDHYICLIAIEHMINGRLEGMSGAEHFTYEALNYDIAESVMNKFKAVFSKEDYYMEHSDCGIFLAATEKFFAKDFKVGAKVASCPQLNREAFKKVLREGDVVLIYRTRKAIGLAGVALNKVNSWITGSSFMSIKLVGPEGKTIIGYGAKIGSTHCREVPVDYFLDTCKGVICIRHTAMTPQKAREIINWARSVEQKDVGYDTMTILKTAFSHKKEAKKGPAKILNKEEAKGYYTPMICTTLVTAAFRGAGVDPGVNFSDKSAWPVDVLKSDKFKPVATWFIDGEGPNMQPQQSEAEQKQATAKAMAENKEKLAAEQKATPVKKEDLQKADATQHEMMQKVIAKEKSQGTEALAEKEFDDAFTEFYIASTEEFFSKDAKVRELVKNIRKVSPEEFQKIAQEGDAVTVTRTGEGNWKSWMNKHVVQKQSFTSLKMIGPGCKTVIGFGVKIGQNGGGKIDEIPYEDFARTCKAMVLCRPKEASADQLHKAYMFMRAQQGRNLSYMSVGQNLASVARHAFNYKAGANNKTPMSKQELENYSGALLCSSVVANAWRYAGIDNGFHSTAEKDVWPRDFLMSNTLEYPAAYFASGELPSEYNPA